MKNFIFFLFLILFPSLVYAAGVEHKLNVRIGIFDAARVGMKYELNNNNYRFISDVATAGMFGKLYFFNAQYSSKGLIKNDSKIITQDYSYKTKSSSHDRTKQLVFDNGILDHRLSSLDGTPKRVEITLPETPFDASDMQSIFALLAYQVKQNKFCAMEKTIFDGKKLYQIIIKDEGKEYFQDEEVPFSGPSLKCSIYIHNLDEEADNDLLLSTTSERPVYFWILEDKETKMPFLGKIEISSTPLGTLKAYTTEVSMEK